MQALKTPTLRRLVWWRFKGCLSPGVVMRRSLGALLVGVVSLSLGSCAPFSTSLNSMEGNYRVQQYFIPKTILTATVAVDDTGQRTITLGSEFIADPRYLFHVNYTRSIVHDDDLHVETEKNGLLKSVQANSTDQTVAIIEKAANIFLSEVGGTPSTGTLRTFPSDAIGTKHRISVQFDPFDPDEFRTHNTLLHQNGYCIMMIDRFGSPLTGSCSGRRGKPVRNASYQGPLLLEPKSTEGFYYRIPQQHRLVVYKKDEKSKTWAPMWSGYHEFVNQADLLEVRVERGTFIKLESSLTFVDGVLTKFTINKPSELYGFMSIPSIVVNTVIQIPGLQATSAQNDLKARQAELKLRQDEAQLRADELAFRREQSSQTQVVFAAPGATTQRSGGVIDSEQRFMSDCQLLQGTTIDGCQALWRSRQAQQ